MIETHRSKGEWPQTGRRGWPWDLPVYPEVVPPRNSDVRPVISIVIPNYNHGLFIETAIRSVLLQDFPAELIIIDEGSTDDSLEIIRRYAPRLAFWSTGPWRGQTEVLNEGLARASGEIVSWLCSDDYFLPGAFRRVADAFAADPAAGIVAGRGLYRNSRDPAEQWTFVPRLWEAVPAATPFAQPSCFFKKALVGRDPILDSRFAYAMDVELWARLKHQGVRPLYIDDLLSVSQVRHGNKTSRNPEAVFCEFQSIYERYAPEKAGLARWHRRLRYPVERFWQAHPGWGWKFLFGPWWAVVTLVLMAVYGRDAWWMRWMRWG